jgi:hypothetical protein
MDAVLLFLAALLTLRLAAELARRYRSRRTSAYLAWSASLATYALATGALAWGAAAGWNEWSFRAYYLFGALLTAPLLGVGSLLRIGIRLAGPIGLAWIGLSIGLVPAVPLEPVSGTEIPSAPDVLALWPARVVAIVGNAVGTLAAVAVALLSIRRRPLGNALLLAGIVVAALGTALAGLGLVGTPLSVALAAALLYGGFVVSGPSSSAASVPSGASSRIGAG